MAIKKVLLKCSICGQEIKCFSLRNYATCFDCKNLAKKEYNKKNREGILAKQKEWRKKVLCQK